jgi:eukaryotic-like serine/threonine-protein kinase
MNDEEIFHEALARSRPGERATYLDQACAGDPALRAAVEGLLRASAGATGFLAGPAATVDEPLRERPGTVVGPYKLLQQIGEGGMGTVFMAEQTHPVQRKVAVKVIKAGMDSAQVIARFEAERQALAVMDHVNIARVLDAGTTDSGLPYFVMELVHGVPITNYCDDNRLSPRERLELFVPVCQAIQHAHQKGIIHRDIKPSNVMITLYDGKPVPKVIDFGVAKATEQRLTERTLFTQYGTMVGTLEYMSPEQAEMSALGVDTRSDIFSLGVLLYELLTGSTPLSHQRLREAAYGEILRMIREEMPPKPSTRLSDSGEALASISAQRHMEPAKLTRMMRGELDWMVMKCLEKDRARRYETASGLAADVQRYLNDEPVQACSASASYRFRKFARRNKRALATAAVLALAALLVIGVVAGSVGWMARDRSVRQAKLNLGIGHALTDATKARDQALTLTDNPYRWEAALAEAASELKRAQGLASQDEIALEPAMRERLQALHAILNADEADRRFAVRFDDIRLEQTEVNLAISQFKTEIAFAAFEEAFQRYYRIEFGVTPSEQAVTIIQQRPKAMQDFLLAALEITLDNVPNNDRHVRTWLATVLDAADTGPWRKRAQQALQASDWKAFEQVVEEAIAARQPQSLLLRLAGKTPGDSPIRLKVSRRIRQAYPGDFWANHDLANYLQYCQSPQLEEAIRYYSAALALRPHNPAACVNLGNALSARGDLDGALSAYNEALDGHPDYAAAHERLALALEKKGDLDGAIAEQRETIRLRKYERDHKIVHNRPEQTATHTIRSNPLWLRDHSLLDNWLARKAILDDPKSADVHLYLGKSLQGKGELDQAIAHYRKATEYYDEPGKKASAHFWLGKALLGKGLRDQSIVSFKRAIQLDPGHSRACHNFAFILANAPDPKQRDLVGALRLAQTVVELAPNAAGGWKSIAWAHYRTGDWKGALAAMTKVKELGSPGDSIEWFLLAMVHWQLGDKTAACMWFDKAVAWMEKNQPKDEELRRFRAEAAELLGIEKKD